MLLNALTALWQEHAPKVAEKASEQAEKIDIGGTIIHHVSNSREIELPFLGLIQLPHFADWHILGMTVNMSPSKHVVMMWIVAVLLLVIFSFLARPTLIPKGLYNFFEMLVVFIREEVVRPNFKEKTDKYISYFLTLFFFILFMNLLGLIPYAASATGNIAVTATLATVTFFVTQYTAIKSQGLGGYLKHLTGGVHPMIWPIMIPVEVIGLFTKPFALTIRLFANMIAGHIVILSLIGLIFVLKSYFIAPISIAFALFIYLIELFVAFVQAYIFTLLSSLFIGMGIHHAHEEHAAEVKH